MTGEADSPLSADQLTVLAETRALTKKLRMARGMALTNVIGLGAFALLSLLFGAVALELSPVGLALAGLAWNEHRGRAWLIAGDSRAPTRLAINQLMLLALVLAYCAWNAYTTWYGPDPLQALTRESAEASAMLGQLDAQLGEGATELGAWVRTLAILVYAVVAGVSVLVQCWVAYYYYSRRSAVEALARAPAWAKMLQ